MRTPADRPSWRRFALVLIGSFAVVALAGCGIFSPDESDDGGGGGGTTGDFSPPYVSDGADGLDRAISNLELSYELMNYEEYEKLIHTGYVFRVDPADVNIVGQAELSSLEDLDSTFKMFNSQTGLEPILDANGDPIPGEFETVPPVQSIRLELTPASGSTWVQMEDGEFVGAWRRIYEVDMTVTYVGEARIDQIQGKQVFYLIEGTVEASDTPVWQLRAWEDQGINS